jgi:hypothetical protein
MSAMDVSRVNIGRRASILAFVAAATLAAGVTSARADTPIESYAAVPSTTQAGGHPDVEVSFAVANRFVQHSQSPCNCEDAKDATVDLPAGFIGNPHATPQCTVAQFAIDACPIDSQVGIVHVVPSETITNFNAALYNIVPPPDEAGLLAFKIYFLEAPQFTVLSSRTDGDFGLRAVNTSIYHGETPLQAFREVLWGIPADHSHDLLRLDRQFVPGRETAYAGNLCAADGSPSTEDPSTVVQACDTNFKTFPPVSSNSPRTPFLQNPTNCDAPLSSSLNVLSYDGGKTSASAPWPQMTGCDQLSFNPSLYAQPTTTAADSPSGVDVDLIVPQQLSPEVPSPTELRGATVVLPPGFSINPNAADGKTACTDLEARFGTTEEAQCPEFAKVGSLEIDSSALPAPIPGYVYLGQPVPGNRYRVFLTANGFATHIKLAGTASPDIQTGQLTIVFQNLPQSPLTAFNMHFFGSERGLLATPTQCGTYPVTSTFTPWDSSIPPQTSTQFFKIESGPNDAPCPGAIRSFAPGFAAYSSSTTAGSHSPFTVNLTRADGDQNLTGVNVTTPPGFSATLKGIPYCSEAAIAAASGGTYSGFSQLTNPSCPGASQIGTAVIGVGAGTHPVYLDAKVYLAGPYKGAPLSLVVITPAVSGPYDLGSVLVRAALEVDPLTAEVTALSDRFPQIIEGVPLRLRSIRVALDRANFALNPTNCDPLAVEANAFGDQGGRAGLAAHFQVTNCAALPFSPQLSLRLSGGVRRRGHPAIHAVFSTGPGEANPSSIAVTLPSNELLDNAHIDTVCTKVDFAKQACPAGAMLGHAEVTTPLLDRPLQGPAYLRSSGGGLPDLALDLGGQFHIEAVARIDAVNGGLRTTFSTVPDVPLGTVALDLLGGSKGLIQNSESLCGGKFKAKVLLSGQNGRRLSGQVPMRAACGRRNGRPKSHRARARLRWDERR